jgi:predicted metal-dependent phosphoesterase TrpH
MWSGDSTTTEDELVEAVRATSIDVLCVTDHHAIDGARRLRDVLPCRVIVGEEVRSTQGEIIGLFLEERVPFGLSPNDTASRIREQGGLVYIPHPFDPMRRNLAESALEALAAEGLVDAIEARNAKTSLESLNRRAAEFAASHDIATGAGSDAHVPDAIGSVYVEIADFDDAPSFLTALRAGSVVGHHSDPPRQWRPRIIPSVSTD